MGDITPVAESFDESMSSTVTMPGEDSRDSTAVSTQTSSEETTRASSPNASKSTSSNGTKKDKDKTTDGVSMGTSNASNLVGRINNLVTTDLGNIIDARDLMFVLVYIPLQIILCMTFLYLLLGWRCVDYQIIGRGN
jgi:hypothetical protein